MYQLFTNSNRIIRFRQSLEALADNQRYSIHRIVSIYRRPQDVAGVYLYTIFRGLLRGVKEHRSSAAHLPTSATTAVCRLTYKSNSDGSFDSSFSHSLSFPFLPLSLTLWFGRFGFLRHPHRMRVRRQLSRMPYYLSLSFPLFFKDVPSGCWNVSRTRGSSGDVSTRSRGQRRRGTVLRSMEYSYMMDQDVIVDSRRHSAAFWNLSNRSIIS